MCLLFLCASIYINSSKAAGSAGVYHLIATTSFRPYHLRLFLWEYTKDHIYSNFSPTIPELKTSIRVTFSSITEETLRKVIKNSEFCMRLLLSQNKAHFKNLLNWLKFISSIIKMSYSNRKYFKQNWSYELLEWSDYFGTPGSYFEWPYIRSQFFQFWYHQTRLSWQGFVWIKKFFQFLSTVLGTDYHHYKWF